MIVNNHALLIGVEDYSAVDRAEGRPAGTSDVAGAVEDVRAWYRTCRAMGIPKERIVALTWPVIAPSMLAPDAVPTNVGAATREGIAWGVDWLARGIASSPRSAGLATFSGHGEQGRGVVICPADMRSDEDVIRLPLLREVVGGGPQIGSLTVVLDCCRDAKTMPYRGGFRARMRGMRRRVPKGPGDARLMAACEPNETASSGLFGGVTMGAFTWALTAALGQWRAEEDRGVLRFDVTYGELLHRARTLLRALSFEQIPVLGGAPLAFRLPFLEPEGVLERGGTRSEPTCRRGKRQLDPGQKDFRVYQMWFTAPGQPSELLAKIAVTSAAGAVTTSAGGFDFADDDEYWFVSSIAAGRMASAQGGVVTLSIEGDYAYESDDPRAMWSGDVSSTHVVQRTPAPVTWAADARAYASGALVFESEDRSLALAFTLQREDPARGGDVDFRRIDWYQPGARTLFRDGATTATLRQITATSASPAAYQHAVSDFELFCDLR